MTTGCTDVAALIQRGEYADALALLRRQIEVEAKDASELCFLAGWCLEVDPTGDEDTALAYYRRAATESHDPIRRARSLYREGWLLMHARRWDEAAHVFEEIIESTSAEPSLDEQRDAHYWRAGCLEARGRYLDALAGYRVCIMRFPLIAPEARFREIVCLDQVGQFTEALAACEAFDAIPPEGFDAGRFRELSAAVARERELLERCIDEGTPSLRVRDSA